MLLVDLPGVIKVIVRSKLEPSGRSAQRYRITSDQNGQGLHEEPQLYNCGRVESYR